MRRFLSSLAVLMFGIATLGTSGCDNGGNGVSLQRIEISPAVAALAKGTALPFTATAVFSDSSTEDVTAQAEWTSSNANFVSVGNTSGTKGLVSALQETGVAVTITAVFDDQTATAAVTVSPAQIRQISVTPSTATVSKGLTQQFTAMAILSDNTTQNVTQAANWTTSDAAIATVGNGSTNKGLASAVGNSGQTATITASLSGIQGSAALTVTSASVQTIQVTPASAQLPKDGFDQAFKATGIFSDGTTADITTQVVWASSAANTVATISNADGSKGVATSGGTSGTTNITAKLGSVTSAAAVLTISNDTLQSIEIDAANKPFAPAKTVSVGIGRTLNFVATGTFSGSTPPQDLTNKVLWSTGSAAVATISNASGTKGQSVTQSVGSTAIGAKLTIGGVDFTDSVTLNVTAADLVSLRIEAPATAVPRNYKLPLRAIGTFSDGSIDDVTTEVTWTSSASSIATVANTPGLEGVVSAGSVGPVTITASSGGVGSAVDLTVTDATLTAISVTPSSPTIKQGLSQQYKAIGQFSDGSSLDITLFDQVLWSSSDTNVARFAANNGSAFAFAQGGPITISARRVADNLSGTATLNVQGVALVELFLVPQSSAGCPAARLTTEVERVPEGFSRRFLACARYFDGFIGDVTASAAWLSQAPDVVTIENTGTLKGRATALERTGEQGVIQATFTDEGLTEVGTFVVRVISGTMSNLMITADRSLAVAYPAGTVIHFAATATFTEGTTTNVGVNVTESVNWNSSDDDVAVVSNINGSRGVVTVVEPQGLIPGTTTMISADRDGVNSNAPTVQRAN